LTLTADQIALYTAQFALSKKADQVTILDLRELTSVTDFFVICTALSDTHMQSIAEGIRRGMRKKYKNHVWHVEGEKNAKWILLDYVDVVVHIFKDEEREFYALERLWGDAPKRELTAADFDETLVSLTPTDETEEPDDMAEMD